MGWGGWHGWGGEWGPSCAVQGVGAPGVSPASGLRAGAPARSHPPLEGADTRSSCAQCSRTCGKGWRKRSVACKSTNPSARAQLLPDAVCTTEPKPRTHEACLLRRCHKHRKLQWLVSAWSQVGAPSQVGVPDPR